MSYVRAETGFNLKLDRVGLSGAEMRLSGAELVRAIPLLRDTYQKCVTGGTSNKQVLLEDLVVRLVGKK